MAEEGEVEMVYEGNITSTGLLAEPGALDSLNIARLFLEIEG